MRFKERLIIDIMYLDGKPVLQIVDQGTSFGAARVLKYLSTKNMWGTIIECWATIYTGIPRKIIADQGSQFGMSLLALDQ